MPRHSNRFRFPFESVPVPFHIYSPEMGSQPEKKPKPHNQNINSLNTFTQGGKHGYICRLDPSHRTKEAAPTHNISYKPLIKR